MKTILYATDYSDNSVAALKYAYGLSMQMDARLVVTHAFGYPVIVGLEGLDEPFPHSEEASMKSHRLRLEKFCKEHLGEKCTSPKLQCEPVTEKSAVTGIISKANDWHAYLIVVGVKGESAVRELLLGSTTKQLIDKAPCPVLAIPADTEYTSIKTIVYASDFEEEDVYAIRKLAEIAEPFNAEIRVVHISTKKEYKGEMQLEWFKDELEEKVTYDALEFELVFSENIFESLRTYLEDIEADLVVMLEREKVGVFRKLFHQDLVKKMEDYGKVPLLSFREGNHQLFYFKAAL
ncbi:universal stress protein [Flavobacteriaceae bacterium TP-CH-4]|uniref:Universal stress protein n=1 Tax=Pelagihabitans pacificus TaxID=2696054 RepID=A0A967AUS2_9FLAO|nr:universal stress protein [Pelagihabitans pacificus]NHF59750.1 universal stress protein [Pelagihabitans pacificus]